MSFARDRDLERWEQGELSMSDLVALHGSDGAAGMVVLHRRLSALLTIPVGDPESVWRVISERLPAVAGQRRTVPFRRRLTRPLAIAAAAVLVAGTAYAGSPNTVQRYITSFWHTVQSVLNVDAPGNAPPDADRPSGGGGQGDGPAAVDDAGFGDGNGDEANEGEQGSGGTSTVGEDEQAGDDENEAGDHDGEGAGANDDGDNDNVDDDADEDGVESDGDGSGGSAVDEDDPSGDGTDPSGSSGDDETEPSGSGGGEDSED
jgi:hypothetical protein